MKKCEYWDKSCYGKDKSNEMPHAGGNFIAGFAGTVIRLLWRLNIQNIENIRLFKGKTGLVLVSNHSSYLDVVCIYCSSRFRQWVRFIGREDLFDKPFLGRFLCWTGAFPIKRDAADRTCIKRATKMLKNNEIVGIMPEGTRRGKGSQPPKLHSGAAFIARMGGNVPIIPTTAINVEKIKRKNERLRFPKVSVAFGNPVMLRDFDFLPKKERLEAASWYAMRECYALNYQCEPEEVNMKKLFPDSTDYTEVFASIHVPKHTAKEIADEYSRAQNNLD